MVYHQRTEKTDQSYHLSLLLMVIIGMLLTIHIQICLTQNLTKNLTIIDTACATKFDGYKTLFAVVRKNIGYNDMNIGYNSLFVFNCSKAK